MWPDPIKNAKDADLVVVQTYGALWTGRGPGRSRSSPAAAYRVDPVVAQILEKNLDNMSFLGNHTKEGRPRELADARHLEKLHRHLLVRATLPHRSEVACLFKNFYNGFTSYQLIRYPYLGSRNKYELPIKFHFEKIDTEADSMPSVDACWRPFSSVNLIRKS